MRPQPHLFLLSVNFPFYIARRYLFSKKSHNAINIISAIGVCGVTISTIALVCTLAVFSGFKDLVSSLFTEFDAPLVITAADGKYMSASAQPLQALRQDKAVAAVSETFTENALLIYNGRQAMVTLKGVDDNFTQVSRIERILFGDGTYMLQADVLNYGILGIQIAAQLGTGVYFPGAIQVYAPRKGERINPANPAESFKSDELFSPGVLFEVNQQKYDGKYVLTSLSFVRNLFEREDQITALELRLKPDADETAVKARLQEQLGADYKVSDRYEMHEEAYRTMEIEKVMAYLFLTFILLIACFNIIGSLSMLIIDKKDDVQTLRNLGATDKQIIRIFLFEGRMISTIGAILGVGIGLLLCWGQQQFGWLRLGSSSGNFIVDAYPVSVHATDVLLVFFTVIAVGYLFVWYPVHYLSRRLL